MKQINIKQNNVQRYKEIKKVIQDDIVMKLNITERTWFFTALSRPSRKTSQITDPAKSVAALTLVPTSLRAAFAIPTGGTL